MDSNSDGIVNGQELEEWIRYVQLRSIHENVNRQWALYNPDNLTSLSWDVYHHSVYGGLHEIDASEADEQLLVMLNMLSRDERRWKIADLDKDGLLNLQEFHSFLHPEQYEHMRTSVIQDVIDDMDKNKDNLVSIEEFISDVYKHDDQDEEPEWVKHERKQFALYHDKNHDEYLDVEELGEWISPSGFNVAAAEASHLLQESDLNKDGDLTSQEILDKYDLFVGSQVTDFGQVLAKIHDEF